MKKVNRVNGNTEQKFVDPLATAEDNSNDTTLTKPLNVEKESVASEINQESSTSVQVAENEPTRMNPELKNLTKLDYEDEILGSLFKSMSWTEEGKKNTHIINALFSAAKYDIRLERQTTKKYTNKYKEEFYEEDGKTKWREVPRVKDLYTEGLDAVIDGIFNNIDFATEEAKDRFIVENKATIKENLKKPYSKLKDDLYHVRVLGTGNTNIEKVQAAAKICFKSLAAAALVVGEVLGICGIVPAAIMVPIALPFAPYAFKRSKSLSGIRDDISKVLENLNKELPKIKELEMTAMSDKNQTPVTTNTERPRSGSRSR